MLTSLTRARRSGAGKLLALIYLLCVLVPSVANAFTGAERAQGRSLHANCEAKFAAVVNNGQAIYNAGHSDAGHSDAGPSDASHSDASHLDAVHRPGLAAPRALSPSFVVAGDQDVAGSIVRQDIMPRDHHQSSKCDCCAAACSSGLPMAMPYFSKPSSMVSRCTTATYRQLASSALSTHYRPPIL